MKIGTKSVLYGAHCFFMPPWFVAYAWWKLYGFRKVEDPYAGEVSLWNPLLWLCFFLHDLGYWGKPNMDGEEGEMYPWWAAHKMAHWFDTQFVLYYPDSHPRKLLPHFVGSRWGQFCLFHSRFLSKKYNRSYSMLCVADKLAVGLEPWWLYLPRVIASGEINEYMALARDENGKYGKERRRRNDFTNRREWQTRMSDYCRSWAFEHRDGRQDTWTPNQREARDASGVWK